VQVNRTTPVSQEIVTTSKRTLAGARLCWRRRRKTSRWYMRRSLFAQKCPRTEYTHSRYTDYNRNRSDNKSDYIADPESDRRGQIRIQILL